MAKYTTSLRSICEAHAGLDESLGQASVDQVIADARESIFDFDYPIYDEEYRSVLETKIIRHYYTREICAETVGLWKLFLQTRMNEIMPYYNKLYQSELLEFDPLEDVDYSKTGHKEGEHEGTQADTKTGQKTDTSTGTISDEAGSDYTRTDNMTRTDNLQTDENSSVQDDRVNDHWDYYSDTPQGSVQNLENLTYLTNARHVTDDGTGSQSNTYATTLNTGTRSMAGTVNNAGSSSNVRTLNTTVTGNQTDTLNTTKESTTTEEYLERVKGRTGRRTSMEMLMELRKTFLNIDMLIIRDLGDLFFGLWE